MIKGLLDSGTATVKERMPLFEIPARARKCHPVQSHLAADRKNDSRTLSSDRLKVLNAIAHYPGRTAKQLDLILDGKAHRRSIDLERLGYITRTTLDREKRAYITQKGKELLGNN